MKLLDLIPPAKSRQFRLALTLVVLSALAGAGQIALLNQAVLHPRSKGFQIFAGCAFFILLIGGFLLRWRGAARLMTEIELALLDRRRRLFDRIRGADLRTMETLDGIAANFHRDMDRLAALSPVLIDCLSYAAMLVAFAVYLLALSGIGALVWLCTVATIAYRLYRDSDKVAAASVRLDRAWTRRQGLVAQLTGGFAQLKMDPLAADALIRETHAAGREFEQAQQRRFEFVYKGPLMATTIFYVGLAVLLFQSDVAESVVPKARFEIVTVLFFSITAITYLVRELHAFVTAEQALNRLEQFEHLLGEPPKPSQNVPMVPLIQFDRVELQGVCFSYRQQQHVTFTVGPIDLTLRRGEVVFITGSNGSGKTTLMKLLTGLYTPDQGTLRLDDEELTDPALYRSLFTSVFMDHHLFGPAYGIDVSDRNRVQALLRRFNLEGIVRLEHGRFAPLQLSTGQRKRLAMVVALLEDRPVYVLDEWAAHQDPYLRRYFYETLLPELRAAGKTIVAISHDARFFHLADRRLHLVQGQLRPAD
jgi:putative ATP-binding cassette transporter